MEAPFAHAGETAALGAAVCWTITALAFESAGRRIGSLAVNLIRLFMALAVLVVACWVLRGRPLPTDASAHNWLWLSVSGLVGFTVGDLCLFRALLVLGARRATLMMALVPPITALTGWLLMGEVLSFMDWAGMALTVGGVAVVVSERHRREARAVHGRVVPAPEDEDGSVTLGGILLGLGGAAGQAVGLAFSKFGMQDYDTLAATQIRIIAGIAGFSVLFLFIGWWPRVLSALRDGRAMFGTSMGAFFGPFLGVVLSLAAVKYTDSGVAATIMALSPVLIIPPAVLIQKERVSLRAVLGAVTAVVGVALLFL
jgi:drug/metabolite transporter (DMT)-like permease